MRSLITFTDLTAWEIFWRLLIIANSLPWVTVFLTGASDYDIRYTATLGGLALTGLVVFFDARRASLPNPAVWALVVLIPFVGWVAYAHRRGARSMYVHGGTRAALWRALRPFRQEQSTLWTSLEPEECAARLQDLRASLLSPGTWFAPQRERPLVGSVSSRGFRIKRGHFLVRPGLLTQARGRFERDGHGTRVELEIGVARWEMISYLALALLMTVGSIAAALATAMSPRPPSSAPIIWLMGPVIVLFVYVMVRAVSMNDDVFLRRLIMEHLQAQTQQPASPAVQT